MVDFLPVLCVNSLLMMRMIFKEKLADCDSEKSMIGISTSCYKLYCVTDRRHNFVIL